jgi:hypothetical protein
LNQFTQLLGTNYYAYALAPQLEELRALGANAIIVHLNFPTLGQFFHLHRPRYTSGIKRLSLFSV